MLWRLNSWELVMKRENCVYTVKYIIWFSKVKVCLSWMSLDESCENCFAAYFDFLLQWELCTCQGRICHRRNILACTIIHHPTRANVNTCLISVCPSPGVAQHMLIGYTNGFSICECPFLTCIYLKIVAYQNVTMDLYIKDLYCTPRYYHGKAKADVASTLVLGISIRERN